MSENKDIQGKSTQLGGLKKSIHKSMLKDGEYHHLKNGITSSFEGDMPFIQNAPSNIECLQLPTGFVLIGSKFVKEKNFHIIFIVNPTTGSSQIGYFNSENCSYSVVIDDTCLGFDINHPIKATYQYLGCELNIYFQDGFNRDRHINLDDIPYKQQIINNCLVDIEPKQLDCTRINIQNDLTPPVVKPVSVVEAGALYTGVYQFAVAYANINGDVQSSYYSKTNPLPIYEDRFASYDNTEGSPQNKLTDKAIVVEFSNIDIRYDYINLAVIKTVQGTPAYELVATLPISTTEYTYTGRETTKLLSIDSILGLYPDYYNSKTITAANNYLIRANLSTQDEGNYQRLANLISLEWAMVRKKADEFDTTYKNPLNSVNYRGYQRGEVYPFGIQFLLSNGRKTAVFHIPGRTATADDLVEYTQDNYPNGQACNFFELLDNQSCNIQNEDKLYKWQIYDTSRLTERKDETNLDKCYDGPVAWGDFSYWESGDTYPCNQDVWGELSGQPIRHHKFPTNNSHGGVIHHHNVPYTYTDSADTASTELEKAAYLNNNTFIYPMGVRLKNNLDHYKTLAKDTLVYPDGTPIFSQEELDLIVGYEIVRGDRTGNKSVIAKGLMYNARHYEVNNPSNNIKDRILYPNYPFNDLKDDKYINKKAGTYNNNGLSEVCPSGCVSVIPPAVWTPSGYAAVPPYNNPFNYTFTLPETYCPSGEFTITYTQYDNGVYTAVGVFFGDDATAYPDGFAVQSGDLPEPDNGILYELSAFTFHSPDTSFKKPFLGTYINLHSLEYGAEYGRFEKVEGHPLFKPASRTDSCNYAVAFKSLGNYNSYKVVPETNINFRRALIDSGYLAGNSFVKMPGSNTKVNNTFRESSVALILNCDISDPDIADESRYTVSQDDKCDCRAVTDDRVLDYKNAFEVDPQRTENYHWISSYYASLRINIANQYGQINTVKYVSTGKYHDVATELTSGQTITFGGDTFITRFTLKRKHSFYNVNFIGQSPVGITYKKSEYANIPTPTYHGDNEKGGVLGEYVIDYSTSKLDCTVKGFQGGPLAYTRRNRNGYFYLFNTGIVNFFVESDINTELRYSLTNPWETWYPKLKGLNNFWEWMEEVKCPINFDNTYLYNFDYSKQNTEEALFPQAADFNPRSQCKDIHPGRIIYSKQTNPDASTDYWLINPANNYYDGDTNLGAVTDIQALDTFRVLVRYENGSQVFNAYDTLQLTNTTVSVGTGGMFAQRPQTFGETETGYAGSQSKFAIDTSQYGTFFHDRKRGKVFHIVQGIEEISNYGMFDWFAENLEFKISSVMPNFDLDNPYAGVGYCSVYDNRFNLWFLTKKDYVLVNPGDISNISYNPETNQYSYKKKPIDFEDATVWENVGWTISYSPIFKAWQSYHSFIPNYYISDISTFHSGLKGSSIYTHWDKFTFQNYYGKQYPFEVTITTAKEELTSVLQSIEYNLKVQKYLNNNYQDLYENHNINFTKAIVSTDNQSSGYLNLIKKDNANPYQSLQYPIINPNSLDVLYSKIEGHKYRINQFSDLVLDKNNNIPIFLHSLNGVDFTPNNIDYAKVNTLNTQPFRNEFFDVTLINDEHKEYKFIMKTFINKTVKSLR